MSTRKMNKAKRAKNRKGRRGGKTPVFDFGREPTGPSPWVVTPVGFPFPERHRIHMRYCDTVQLTSAAGVIGTFAWYTNGIYDPQVSVGGHQPMGFDQAMAYYGNAVVLESKIKCDLGFITTAAAALTPVACGVDVHVSGVASPYTNWTAFREAGYQVKFLAANAVRPVTVRAEFNHEKFFQEDPRGSYTETGNFITGNPARLAQYKIWVQPVDQATTIGAIDALVQIDYDVELSRQNQLAQS